MRFIHCLRSPHVARWVNMTLALLLLAGGAMVSIVSTPRPAAADNADFADMGVEPIVAPPGTTFAFFATGFDGEELVTYWFNGPGGVNIGDPENFKTYTYEGRADWTWDSPTDAPRGHWTAIVHSPATARERVIHFKLGDPTESPPAEAPVGVPSNRGGRGGPPTSAPPNSGDVAVQPVVGYPGTEFSFYALGFDGSTPVGYWFNAPDGRIYGDTDNYKTHTYQGRADWSWKTGNTVPIGVWSTVVHDPETETQRIIYFEVRDPSVPLPDPSSPYPAGAAPPQPPVAPADEQPTTPDTSGIVNPPGVGVEPVESQPESDIAFFATGFNPRDTVHYWTIDPTGASTDYDPRKTGTNDEGRADWTWRAPGNARSGTWTMVAVGKHSQVRREITFKVYNPTSPPPADPSTSTTTPDNTPNNTPDTPVGNPADVGVWPAVVQPNEKVAFFATGFNARDTVHYWTIDPNGTSTAEDPEKTGSNEEGRADWTWNVPDNPTPGVWTMVAEGEHSHRRKEIRFTVQAAGEEAVVPGPPPAQPGAPPASPPDNENVNGPNVGVEPAVGTPDAILSFFAAGFELHDTVYYHVIDPAGQVYTEKDYKASTHEGRADWTWKVPTGAVSGIWTMVAKGQHSNFAREIYFEVYNPEKAAPPSSETPGGSTPADGIHTAVEPPVGTRETKFAFAVEGFNPRDTVYYWTIDPMGRSSEQEKKKTGTNDDGRADWTWRPPDAAIRGRWTMVILGEHTGIRKEIQFEILPSN